jgi:mono/diheme cytochrome c family protein
MSKLKIVIFISIIILVTTTFIAYAAMAPAAGSAVDAKALFDSKCSKCHGKDGRAKSLHAKHVHARDFTAADWQNEVSDERIFNSISNGKGKMPAFKKDLSDEQIEALGAYVRTFRK